LFKLTTLESRSIAQRFDLWINEPAEAILQASLVGLLRTRYASDCCVLPLAPCEDSNTRRCRWSPL